MSFSGMSFSLLVEKQRGRHSAAVRLSIDARRLNHSCPGNEPSRLIEIVAVATMWRCKCLPTPVDSSMAEEKINGLGSIEAEAATKWRFHGLSTCFVSSVTELSMNAVSR